MKRERLTCPYCGYRMPIEMGQEAVAKQIYVRCKGRNCKKKFEIKVGK